MTKRADYSSVFCILFTTCTGGTQRVVITCHISVREWRGPEDSEEENMNSVNSSRAWQQEEKERVRDEATFSSSLKDAVTELVFNAEVNYLISKSRRRTVHFGWSQHEMAFTIYFTDARWHFLVKKDICLIQPNIMRYNYNRWKSIQCDL